MGILIDENSTFIIQGITGREAVNMTRECLDYGSKVVGGVTPGRGGRDVYGVPVYDTIKEIVAKEKVDGSVITVPAPFVRDAAFEAIENGIKLLVIVTERTPRYEVAQVLELARLRGDDAARTRELREALRLYTEMSAAGHAERVARELDTL